MEKIRIDKGLSRVAIGRIMDVTDNAVKKWELGKSEPPLGYLDFLVSEFNYDIKWLLYGEEDSGHKSEPVTREDLDEFKAEMLENLKSQLSETGAGAVEGLMTDVQAAHGVDSTKK